MTNEELAENHARVVRSLRKDGGEIVKSLSPDEAVILARASDWAVDAGNRLDAMKKLLIYRKPENEDLAGHASFFEDGNTGSNPFHDDYHGEVILEYLDPKAADLWHMAIGVATEAAELLDAVCQSILTDDDLDRDNVIEEMGDLEFYMRGIRQILNLSRDQCLSANICKLTRRYPAGEYTNKDAIERKDKA